jgi:glycosyltransferase involved in cell wall biosynthesis
MKLVVLVPAWNEGETVGRVVRGIPRKVPGFSKITPLVIDDGSIDKTSARAKKAGALVVRHILNRGKGAAIITGLAAAKELKADCVVTLDADGQHDPREIARLLLPIRENMADVVVGSRLLSGGKQMPRGRRIVNYLGNTLTRFFFDIPTTDSQSGFRAFGRKAISRIRLQSTGYEIETELFREVKRHHLRYMEVPIRVIYTGYSRSKGQFALNSINMVFRLLLDSLRGYR